MPKTKRKPRSAKKEDAPTAKKTKAQYILDDAGDKVWISTVTLSDIRRACKTGKTPAKNRRELVRIPSKQNRESILTEAGRAIANKEQESMALYGGRPWTVTARVTEPRGENKKPPLFRWFRAKLELAVLPHLLEKIPDPPKLKGNQEYNEQDDYIPSTCLEERTVSSLSWVAWENREYAIPNVSIKWLSPDYKVFYSRKSAWQHQEELAQQQLFLQKMLEGKGHRGQFLKPFKPTMPQVLKAGKWRFLRDGLWVVGQEEAWQQERAEWWQHEQERRAQAEERKRKAAKKRDAKPPAVSGKRSLTALALYLHSERQKYRDAKVASLKLASTAEPVTMTLRQAETELRDVWKTLSEEEQAVWKKRAQEMSLQQAKDEMANDDAVGVAQQESCATGNESVAAVQAHDEKADDPASKEDPTHVAVSPSPPSVPATEGEAQSGSNAPVSSRETQGQVIAASEGLWGLGTSISNALKDGMKAIMSTSASSESASEVLTEQEALKIASLTVPNGQVDTSLSTVATLPQSNGSSASIAAPQVSSCPPVVSVQGSSGSTKKAPPTSSKKRRKSALKKITPSSKFDLTPEQIDLCHSAATDHFELVMHTVKARGLHHELQDGFDLLRERGRGRYDMELPVFDNPEFSFLTDLKRAAWMPLVREILGQDVLLIHKGVFISMPGAEGQVYHQDGPHLSTQTQRPCHAVNVFIPLVDLCPRNGPTEFCLGTHVLGHENFVKERVYTPCVPAGKPVIFDYRLGHRGKANTSSEPRPIVYCTYAAAANGKEFRDSVNFSRRRYHKIGELVEKPLSRAERAAKRRKSQSEAAKDSASETNEERQGESNATASAAATGESEATTTDSQAVTSASEQSTLPAVETTPALATSERAATMQRLSQATNSSAMQVREQPTASAVERPYDQLLAALSQQQTLPVPQFLSQQAFGTAAAAAAAITGQHVHPSYFAGTYAHLPQAYAAYHQATMQQRLPSVSIPATSDGPRPASAVSETEKNTKSDAKK